MFVVRSQAFSGVSFIIAAGSESETGNVSAVKLGHEVGGIALPLQTGTSCRDILGSQIRHLRTRNAVNHTDGLYTKLCVRCICILEHQVAGGVDARDGINQSATSGGHCRAFIYFIFYSWSIG